MVKKIFLFVLLLLAIPSLGQSNGNLLIATPNEKQLQKFISDTAGPGHYEYIKASNNGRPVQLFLFEKNINYLCLGYFHDGSKWTLFLQDYVQPGSMQIRFQPANVASYLNKKGKRVEVDLSSVKALK